MTKIDYWGLAILALSPIIVNIILGISARCTVNSDFIKTKEQEIDDILK